MEEKKGYNFEEGMKAQEEKEGKVTNGAVLKAKENMEKRQLERDAAEVECRLNQAERDTKSAERAGRYASKKKNILKNYSEKLNAAKATFEADGNCRVYDETINKLKTEKEEAIVKAKKDVYGDDAWRIND